MSAVEPALPPRASAGASTGERCSVPDLLGYFLRLGTLGFGGPIALCGYMQRDLVERRGWIAPEDYKQELALAQLAPGPLAAQLAIYLGWVRARVLGATLVALAFIFPSFLMVLALSALYVREISRSRRLERGGEAIQGRRSDVEISGGR
jgi:putative chromate ion transporter